MKTRISAVFSLLLLACGADVDLHESSDPAITKGAAGGRSYRPTGTSNSRQQQNNTSADLDEPEAIHLSDTLFIKAVPEQYYDQDEDFLHDRREEELAEKAAPLLQFSEFENVGTPDTLFQVHPVVCTGPGCTEHRVDLRFGFIWASDGGYYGSASGGCDNSKWFGGDVLGVSVKLSSPDGTTWRITEVNSWKMTFPEKSASFAPGLDGRRTHLRLFVSAGKHHPFFDTSFNDEDSPYSDWLCNDLIDDRGVAHRPALQWNNVGQKEHHPATVDGYDAWEDDPYLQTNALADFWNHEDSAPYVGQLALEYTGVIHGRVDTWQSPGDLVVYFREINAHAKPWGRVQLDGSRFSIKLPAGEVGKQYLFRPVASDWDFESAPYGVFAVPNSEVSFVMTGYPRNLGPLPTEVVAAEPDHAGGLVDLAKLEYMGLHALVTDLKLAMSEQSTSSYSTAENLDTMLPRSAELKVRVYSLLDVNGQPAASMNEANCGAALADRTARCKVGDPVPNARVKFEIVAEDDHLRPEPTSRRKTKLTDRRGDARTKLQTGNHAGRIKVRISVIENPANPWLLPEFTYEVTVQPDFYGDTGFENLSPRLFDSIRVTTTVDDPSVSAGG